MLHDSSVGSVELISSVVGKSSSISSPSTLGVNNSTSMGLRRPKGRKHTQLTLYECFIRDVSFSKKPVVLHLVGGLYYILTWDGKENRPFTSSLVPLFQNEFKCENENACTFIFAQIKGIFIRMVSLLDSLWNRGTWELRNGLLTAVANFTRVSLRQS